MPRQLTICISLPKDVPDPWALRAWLSEVMKQVGAQLSQEFMDDVTTGFINVETGETIAYYNIKTDQITMATLPLVRDYTAFRRARQDRDKDGWPGNEAI